MPRSYKSCSLVCKQKTFFFKERRKFLFKKCIYKLEKSYSTKAERVTLRTTELSMLFVYLFITTSGKKKQKQIPVLKHNLVTGNYCKKKKKDKSRCRSACDPSWFGDQKTASLRTALETQNLTQNKYKQVNKNGRKYRSVLPDAIAVLTKREGDEGWKGGEEGRGEN